MDQLIGNISQKSSEARDMILKKPEQSAITAANISKITQEVEPIQEQEKQKENQSEMIEQAGGFSKFAHQKQIKIKERQQTIQRVINEALISHFTAIKKHTQNQRNILAQHETNKKKIQNMIGMLIGTNKILNIQQFLKQPLVQIAKHQIIEKNGLQSIKRVLSLLTILQNYSIIEGKIIQTNKLMMSQYTKYENNFIIPTTFNNQTFVKFNSSREGHYIFMHNGNLVQRQILMRLSPVQRKSIIEMVILYLKSLKILVDENQIHNKVLKMIADIK